VKAELWFGARKSGRVGANLRKLSAFFEPLASLSFDDAAAEEYADLRAHLESEGRASGVRRVAPNIAEFERVPRLDLERW